MSGPIITEQDKEALMDVINAGQLKVSIEYGRWSIEFNLASAGAESRGEVEVMRANGGIYNDSMRRIAILANNITRIGSLNLLDLPFAMRFDELQKMQPQMRDFLWTAYVALRQSQDTKFAVLIENSKKSLESQVSAITGNSTEKVG